MNNTGDPPIDPGAPVQQPETDGAAIEPLVGPAQQATEPVAGPARPDPVLRAEGSQVVAAPVLEEGALQASSLQANALQTSSGSSVPRLAETAVTSSATPAEGISLEMGVSSAGSAPAAVGVLASDTESSSSSSSLLMGGQQVPLLSVGEYSSILDSAAAMAAARYASSQLPQSSPLSGALPAPAPGSASGGTSLGGTGPDLGGALALLLIALLGGKFLWYARNLLRPDSVYGLIVNQPG